MKHSLLLSLALGLGSVTAANAQMAKGCAKFLGNITTSYSWQEYCDPQECDGKYKYTNYWNQVTCENATKWGSVHSGWGKFNWTNADRTYNYCKQNGILFKFHALIWGSQHPTWIENLSVDDTKKAIIEWFDEVKKHYPDLQIIDVVNEAIYSGSDYHSPYKQTKIIQALGSLAEDRAQKQTGNRPSYNCNTNGYPSQNSYQWLAEAFRLARERWPEAILIYNDYNTFQWQKTEFINLVNGIKACGGPINAAGNQAHDLNDMSGSQFKSALEEIHNKTNLPQYITEYDINKKNDATFETRYKEQFPIMWEADYVAGVTLWGWIYGKTWVNDGGDNGASGLVRNCQDRSAFTWLQNYMKTPAAQNVKNPLPIGSISSIEAEVTLSAESAHEGDSITINVDASSKDGIKFVKMELNDELLVDKWVAPYIWGFRAGKPGKYDLKITIYDANDKTKVINKEITVYEPLKPYNGTAAAIPGKIEAEEFDFGGEGNAYHDNDEENRNKGNLDVRDEGVDMNDKAIGYCQSGEWLKYTVDVKKAGTYTVAVAAATDNSTASFKLYMNDEAITGEMKAPNTGDYATFEEVTEEVTLQAGEQVLMLEIVNDWVDIDYIKFTGEEQSEAKLVDASRVQAVVANNQISVVGANNVEAIALIDASGRTVANTNTAVIDAPGKGVYILKIQTKSNVVVKKVVIR